MSSADDMVIRVSFGSARDQGREHIEARKKRSKARKRADEHRLARFVSRRAAQAARLGARLSNLEKAREAFVRARAAGLSEEAIAAGRTVSTAANLRNLAGAGMRAVGIFALFSEAIIEAGRKARQANMGYSYRKIVADDAHAMFGLLDEKATAKANTRAIFERDPHIRQVVAETGGLTPAMRRRANVYEKLYYDIARGADLIERDTRFDSADAISDQIIQKLREHGVIQKMQEFARWVVEHGLVGPLGRWVLGR